MLKKLEYTRFPLRLGQDVFELGYISDYQMERFLKLMQAFSLFTELYEVSDRMACATSAMREAANGQELADETLSLTGLRIDIIQGEQEAALIARALESLIDDHNYLHIDVGGGSTELNLYSERELLASASFKSGSVRNSLRPGEARGQMEEWIKKNVLKKHHPITAIGTGGNIGKLYELGVTGSRKSRKIGYSDLLAVKEAVESMDTEARIHELMLNPDRADTIVPAGNIYLGVMKMSGIKTIMVPDLGLKDGILQTLLHRNLHKLPEL
ncbi:MAG: phosphatase [Bacteroidota bacterium]